MAINEENKELIKEIKEGKSATIENVNDTVLKGLFKEKKPPQKYKKRYYHKVDKRLKIWRDPTAHAKQRGLHKKKIEAKKYVFLLFFSLLMHKKATTIML